MQMASMNSCLFSVYPIALIGKADSHEDALFQLLLLYDVVSQDSVPLKILFWQLQHFPFFSCHTLLSVVLVYCWSKGLYSRSVFGCRFGLLVL